MASLTAATVVRKASDETVNNSSTLQDDDDLLITMGANEVWYFEAMLIFTSNGTADFKMAFTVPSGATLEAVGVGKEPGGADARVRRLIGSASSESYDGSATTEDSVIVKGTVRVGGTAGNLQLQWAQNTADASDTKLLTDSWLMGARES